MTSPFFRVAAIIVSILFLVACGNISAHPEAASPLVTSIDMPGAHLAYGNHPPKDYQTITTTAQIYQVHENGKDIWFYARTEDLADLDTDGVLRDWLGAIEALLFPLDQATLFWIPVDPQIDRLDFAEKSDLTNAIEPTQQASLWRHRGDQLRTKRSFDAAITAYQRSTALNQTDPESYAGLGAAYLGKGQNEASLPAFQEAIELAPDHYWAHRLLGNAYLNLQRYALAADELTQAYILSPEDTHILLGIALGQGRSGHPDRAIRTLELLFANTDNPQSQKDGESLLQEFSQSHQ
jgi:tetratricopeptide (TPR) repeat protein